MSSSAPKARTRLPFHLPVSNVAGMYFDNPNNSGDPRGPTDPVLSVVVPVYGCQACLRHLHERLITVLADLGCGYEIVMVDDRAEDGSWEEIQRLVALDSSVRGILLSRNFGQHAAITAGLQHARGDWVTVIDCDLQDPPEDIPRLLAKALEGYDVVLARRTRKKPVNLPRRYISSAYYWGLRKFGGARNYGELGTLSTISRKTVDAFLKLQDYDRHYILALLWLGFHTAILEYTPATRYRGRSSYSFSRLVKVATDGVFFQTTFLLRWIVYLGFLLASLSGLFIVYLIASRLTGHVYPGWTSVIVTVTLMGGFIILSTGVTGLYIGKIFDQSRSRPIFVTDQIAEHTPDGDAIRDRTAAVREGHM
jgi:glycosyltransferase involved in cell wall biosynthesis